MRAKKHVIIIAWAGLFCGCAATVTVPRELVDAREAFERASTGVATIMAPARLHVACLALAKAEQSFLESPDSYQTWDLAYIAERRSRMAEISASINIELGRQIGLNNGYKTAGGDVDTKTKESLSGAKEPPAGADSKQSVEIIIEREPPVSTRK